MRAPVLLLLLAGLAGLAAAGHGHYGHAAGHYGHHHHGGYGHHHHHGGYYGGHCKPGRYGCHDSHPHVPSPPATDPTPDPEPDTCGSQAVDLTIPFTEFDPDTFDDNIVQFVQGLSNLVDEPADCITVTHHDVDQNRRRSLLATVQVMDVDILTNDPAAVNAALAQPGALAGLLALLGGRACLPGDTACASVASQSLDPAAAPSPSAGPVLDVPLPGKLVNVSILVSSPAPAPAATVNTAAAGANGGKSSNTGAIIGGVVGGVGGALLLCLAGYLVMRKRGQAGTGAGTFNQAYQTGASATINTGAAAPKATEKFTLEQVVEKAPSREGTPRRRNVTPFNDAPAEPAS